MSSSDTDEELNVSQHDVEDDLNAYPIGKFVAHGREIARAVLMSYIYILYQISSISPAHFTNFPIWIMRTDRQFTRLKQQSIETLRLPFTSNA